MAQPARSAPAGDDLDAVLDQLVETLAGSGVVSATGSRIFALLMASESPLSQADIKERLSVSEGSVSEGTRALEAIGMVERVTYPRVRRDFFKVHPDAWVNCAELTLAFVGDMHQVAGKLRATVGNGSPTVREQVEQMSDYYSLLATELPKILRRTPGRT